MNKLLPFKDINSFTGIAQDFTELLARDDNEDIRNQFPETVGRYGKNVLDAVENFEITKTLIKTGEREQFIVSCGEKAVGLCLISAQIKSPPGIDDSWPNISGFIMNPYRGRGLGRFSIEERMKVVKNNFSNHAWTFVRDDNLISEHLVLSVGFEKTDQQVAGWEGHHLYVYDGS